VPPGSAVRICAGVEVVEDVTIGGSRMLIATGQIAAPMVHLPGTEATLGVESTDERDVLQL